MEPLQRILALATERGLLTPLKGRVATLRSSLYANDATIFLNPLAADVRLVKAILERFGLASGLRINFGKSAAYPIRCGGIDVAAVLAPLGVPIAALPCKYMGLPLGTRQLRRVDWQALIDKIASRLATWKGKMMSTAGRLALLNAVLSSIPVYWPSVHRLPPAGWKLKQEWLPDGWICLVCGASDSQELPPNFIKLAKDAYTPDVMAASDCMLGKVGYGTASEALAYKLPFVFVRRDYFNEEPFLRNLLEHYQNSIEMIRRDFLSGHWKPYLLRALTIQPCYDGPINGGQFNGARRLQDVIVLGYQLQRTPGKDVEIPDWYSLSGTEIGAHQILENIEKEGSAESCCEDFEILHGDLQGLTDTMTFLKSLSELAGSEFKNSEVQSRERTAASVLFDWEREIYVARAPRWLDVMGGIADYSGSLVLQVSFGSDLSNRAPTFDMDLSDFMDGGKPISYEKARRWSAYVAGTILILMTELGVQFADSMSILVSSAVPEGKGVSSSASVEVATMSAIAAAYVLLQPAEVKELVTIPNHMRFWGLDSGIRHRYEATYSKDIPEIITGDAFLEKYRDHNDTTFKALLTAANTDEQLAALGELMYQCHYSYNACGLGSDGTDRLVNLVQEMQHRKTREDGSPSLFGAKITGGGSGGSVCVIGKNCLESAEEIAEIQQRYKAATGYQPILFDGSSPGAGKFGHLKIRWRRPSSPIA
ncbi:hypothetical protein ACQ4PT_072325 [Festuca glaucescens]